MPSSPETRAMTLRLPVDLAEELELVAAADASSISETVRSAIADHINRRRADDEFQQRLREALDRNRRVVRRLSS